MHSRISFIGRPSLFDNIFLKHLFHKLIYDSTVLLLILHSLRAQNSTTIKGYHALLWFVFHFNNLIKYPLILNIEYLPVKGREQIRIPFSTGMVQEQTPAEHRMTWAAV